MASPFVGEIRTFAFNYTPTGWVVCDGRTLKISQYQMLYAVIGNTFGGDGHTTFAVPNLQMATSSSSGASTQMGYLVMNLCIATTGFFPEQP